MSDLIDRQAAISAICNACGKIDCDKMDKCEKLQLPPANNSEIPNTPMTEVATDINVGDKDTISRKAAIKILHEALDAADQIADVPFGVYQNYRDKMNKLPPAQPERIKGRWIYHPEWANDGECGYECSVCHMGSDIDYNFCMRCGADMRGEQNG